MDEDFLNEVYELEEEHPPLVDKRFRLDCQRRAEVTPYFWTDGEIAEANANIYAINHHTGGVLAIAYSSQEEAIAAFKESYGLEIESIFDATDLILERIDYLQLDAILKPVKGNLCRDARGKFCSCGKPVTKVESSLAKKRRENKEARKNDYKYVLKQTDFSDHKQVETLGKLFSDRFYKDILPSDQEIKLKQDWEAAQKLKPGSRQANTLGRKYYDAIREREKIESRQDEALREAIIKHHNISKEAAIAQAKATVFFSERLGKDEDSIREYQAEFYQLTGGKTSNSLRQVTKTEPRAYANKELGMINVGSNSDKATYFHEAAHHVEFESKELMKASQTWRADKATGDYPEPLKEITGNRFYTEDEKAYRGKFFNPYVGKYYNDGATEVISMGIERFSDASSMRQFRNQDRSHFNFTIGVLLKNVD